MKTCPLCDGAYPDTHTNCPQDGALLIESRELATGQMVRGKYKIIKKIGQGGMGTVYMAEDTFLNAQMALKFLSVELSSDPSFTRRFRDEARAAFKLRHPNIVEVNGLDQAEDGSLFISMEYVDGMSLRGLMSKLGAPLAVPGAIQIAHGIACGLGAAHNYGFVHRDIKPENIIVQRRGETVLPKILDFGIVAVMEKAQAADTPSERLSRAPILTAEYAAPEQWGFLKPEELDGRTDIYALGCVFYEMIAGRLPFLANSMEAWMDQHLKAEPVPPSTFNPEIARYPGLDDVVLWAIKKRREDRPAGVTQFLAALDAISEAPASAPMPPRQSVTVMDSGFAGAPRAQTIVQTPSPWQQQPQPPSAWQQQPAYHPPPLQQPIPQPVPAAKSNKTLVWAAGGLALILLLVLGGYALKGKKSEADKDRSSAATSNNPTANNTIPNTPNPVAPNPVNPQPDSSRAPEKGDLPSTVVKPDKPRVIDPPPPLPKPVHVAAQTPAAMMKQAQALYSAANYGQAGPLFEQACTGGSAESCRLAADMYAKGQGFSRNPAKVVQLRNQSCEAGDMSACYQLSFNYNNAEGVPKNMARAEALRTQACDGGYADACAKLGAMYLSEVGFKDEGKAARYYQLACDRGSREGCWFIGKMYDIGKGVPRDEARSKELYTRSCRLGYEQGCEALKAKSF